MSDAVTSTGPSLVSWADLERERSFQRWLAGLAPHQLVPESLRAASSDASFRRYFRIGSSHGSRIIMDAPPEREDCRSFVRMARELRAGGLNAPEVLAWDEAAGFLLLSDLGTVTYEQRLCPETQQGLFNDAADALLQLQRLPVQYSLPVYDEALLKREMDLFAQWYLERHHGCELTAADGRDLARCFDVIVRACLAQPTVLVHRDYHCRNLMVCGEPGSSTNPGILDFQDAVRGPVTYDLVSLLRDAYIEYGDWQEIQWLASFWTKAHRVATPLPASFGQFMYDFEMMSLQRSLKVLGIFSRLYHRDGKAGYLKDLPRVRRYVLRSAVLYPEMAPLRRLLLRTCDSRGAAIGPTAETNDA